MATTSLPAPPAYVPRLLWVDCIAGGLVGLVVLGFSGWFSELHEMPRAVLVFSGAANLAYASYSFSLAVRRLRPRPQISALALANIAWAPVCFGIVALYGAEASIFGIAHFVGEGLFVGGLGWTEWTWRDHLLTAPSSAALVE